MLLSRSYIFLQIHLWSCDQINWLKLAVYLGHNTGYVVVINTMEVFANAVKVTISSSIGS